MIFEILGWITATLTILMYLPQVAKVIRTKSVLNLSKTTFVALYFVEVLFVIWAPMVSSFQVYGSNGFLIFILMPIIYYLFFQRKWVFITIFTIGILAFTAGLLEFIFALKVHKMISLSLSLLLSVTLGILFFPQSWIVFKQKALGKVSGISASLIFLANVLWGIYWLSKLIENSFDGAILVQLIFVFLAALAQTPIIYYFIQEKLKKRRIIKTRK